MTRTDDAGNESSEPGESSDDETEVGFGLTPDLIGNLFETKRLTLNVDAPDINEDDLSCFTKDEGVYESKSDVELGRRRGSHHRSRSLEEEEQSAELSKKPAITSWEYDIDEDSAILDLKQSRLPFAQVMAFVAQHCPKLQILRIYANVPLFIPDESLMNPESDPTAKGEEDSPEVDIYLRCRQTVLPFESLMAILSTIFPKTSHLTLDGDDHTKLDLLRHIKSLPDRFLPSLRRFSLEQFLGTLHLMTFFEFVISHLPHVPFLRISGCNVESQTGGATLASSGSSLAHLEIIPVNVIPFSCLSELVFKAFENLTHFIVENIAVEHQIFLRLDWTKSGRTHSEQLYLRPSPPLKSFTDLLTIVKEFPKIRKLETDECGSGLLETDVLELVRTCIGLQYFSSIAGGKSRIFAISDPFMRQPTSASVSKLFGKQGGMLRLETHDITLSVPEDAIQQEEEIEIGLQAVTNPPSTHFQEDEMVSSFGFHCSVPKSPGFRFVRPVMVTLPHSAILDDPSKVEIGIYSGERLLKTGDVEISTIRYIPPSEDKLPRCKVDQEKITVYIDHFSFEWPVFKIRNPFVRGKRLGCLPFVPKQMPPTRHPILRVHLFDNVKGNPEEITKEEAECDFRKAHPKKELRVKASLDVTFNMDGGYDTGEDPEKTWTVLFKDIRKIVQDSVDFTLDFSTRLNYALVNLMLSERGALKNKAHNLHFNVNFPGTPALSHRDDSIDEERRVDEFGQILHEVAKSLYEYQEIEDLALQLGFIIQDAKRFFEENRRQGVNHNGTLEMLRSWRRGVRNSEERSKLRDALVAAKQIHLADTLLGE